jgi:tagatose-6-phosphate ketose/aldose isomerase
MVLAGQCLGHLEENSQFGETVAQICEIGRRFLPLASDAAASITSLDCRRVCFVGSGALRAVSDESALKVVELTGGQVTTLAETPLGLRHGPLSSLDSHTLFVAFLSSETRKRGYELDLLREIDRKRLGRARAVVTAQGGEDAASLVDYTLSLESAEKFSDYYRPVLDVILSQMLGLFLSIRCGLKPDQPSPAGTITRVVAPIKLYS